MSYCNYNSYITRRVNKINCCCPPSSGNGFPGPTGANSTFTGPKGDTGISGQSFTGPIGPIGESFTGPTGPTNSGQTGPPGEDGQAFTGPTGPAGIDGIDGPTGSIGDSQTGPQGPLGPEEIAGNLLFGATFWDVSGQLIFGDSFWIIPGGDIIATNNQPSPLSPLEYLVTPTTPATRAVPPSMAIQFQSITITHAAIHLTKPNSGGGGWGTPVKINIVGFCDVDASGNPANAITTSTEVETTCSCVQLEPPITVGCDERRFLAVNFSPQATGIPQPGIAPPANISVVLYYITNGNPGK